MEMRPCLASLGEAKTVGSPFYETLRSAFGIGVPLKTDVPYQIVPATYRQYRAKMVGRNVRSLIHHFSLSRGTLNRGHIPTTVIVSLLKGPGPTLKTQSTLSCVFLGFGEG